MSTVEQSTATAAAGANATSSFRTTKQYSGAEAASPERVDAVATAVLRAVHQVIRDQEVTYPEFQAAKAWLIELGEGGEWPLFLDVFVEHVVEEVAARAHQGTKGSILGPYYLPDQQRLESPATLPTRPDEKGTRLVFAGQVRDVDGSPIAGAELDIWQADEDGLYSGFAPHIPDGNLRGVVVTDAEGRFEIRTVQPAPYQIPTDGPTGKLVAAAAWHPWRPAHLHLIVRAEGHRPITTQLYFQGGEWVEDDVAEAVKPELVLDPQSRDDGPYSGFAPHIPDGNLRGVVVTDAEGRFEIRTIQPAPYQIPTDGPTGKLVAAAGWHPWRPAHLHLIVRAEGHRPITTQLYFQGGEWVENDVAEAVKPELVLSPQSRDDGVLGATYDFVLEPA